MNKQSYTGITVKLSRPRQRKSALLGMGLVLIGAVLGAGMFGGTMFTAGYSAALMYRTVQYTIIPFIDARGTYAILWASVSIPIYAIWYSNKKGL